MRITATHIENWSQTRQAQAELPIWVRKLISATNSLSELSMPGGDSIYRPGWDGKVVSTDTSPWVPQGKSVWEMGCNTNITAKANSDFDKRTKEFDLEFQQANNFIFVTPHRWHKKDDWLNEKKQQGSWKAIKVLDADDLEMWFENAPAVALEFGELIGIAGFGAESIASYWQNWSSQSSPCISIEAIQRDRRSAKNTLIELIESQKPLIAVEADSREEASAFCSSVIKSHPLSKRAVCITNDTGWRWVEANPEVQIVILASTNLSIRKAPQSGLTIIQPICHGDDTNLYKNTENIAIPRVPPDAFKQALIDLGEEENDVRRLTSSSGRSWTVYRRLKALNPMIRKPAWLDGIDKDNLIVLLLVGAWDSSSKGDISVIEELIQKPYEEIEDSLCNLVALDDSPVLNISNVWKAKSPVELLYLVAPKLPKSKFNRFISIAKAVLSKPDPALELPESDRWMASIYGKVRSESGVVINSLLKSLIKLKVFAETSDFNISNDINRSIDEFVRTLLLNSSEDVWMSLSSYLPSIAEASPDVFLECIENSLNNTAQPVTCLIKNTTASGGSNRCWYAGLLWALETIAWNSSKLHRVTTILIELDKIPNNTNWGNNSFTTLQSFYRAHWPQCLATVEQKIKILEFFVQNNESFTWRFIYSLLPRGGAIGLNNSRPVWRDDDAGSESECGIYYPHYLRWFANTLIKLAEGKPERIAELMKCYSIFDDENKKHILSLIEEIISFDDVGKEIILNSLRKYISFHRSDDIDSRDSNLERLIAIYSENNPNDLIFRYRWLFQSGWIDLPEGERRDYERTDKLRDEYRYNAIKHIWDELREEGVNRLTNSVEDQSLVGIYIAKYLRNEHLDRLILFALNVFSKNNYQYRDPFLSGVICSITSTQQSTLINILESQFIQRGFTTEQQVSVLACLPPSQEIFSFIDELDSETSNAYWHKISFHYRTGGELFEFILSKFISLNRYHSAFEFIQYDTNKVPPRLVYEILYKLLTVKEEGTIYSDGIWIEKAIEYISESGVIGQKNLALLEFAFYPVFHNPEVIPKNLHSELLSSPETFVELVCLIYKAEGKQQLQNDNISNESAYETAWRVMHFGRGVPGLRDNGSMDASAFIKWIEETRKIGRKLDRETVTDQTIGQWLSNCPEEEDGIWPCYPVCELLEQKSALNIRKGFATGVYNNRGTVTRAYGDGGKLERNLAAKYKRYSEDIINFYPQTALLLNEIATAYNYDAKREDDEASLGDELG